MRVSRVLWIVLALLVTIMAGGILTVWLTWLRIQAWGVGVHQKRVTRSLAEWEREYANINNDASAVRAAEVVGYMSRYYVPGPGDRGPADVEAALEVQRRESISRVVVSLEHYTGLHFGTNAQRWTEWAEERKGLLRAKAGSEPAGPPNGSRPIRSETN